MVEALFGGATLPRVSAVVLRNEPLFKAWVPLMQLLKDGGAFPKIDREIAVLRTAARCRAPYLVQRHRGHALAAGLSTEEIDLLIAGELADGWTPSRRALLCAVDELCEHHRISDPTWSGIRAQYDDVMVLELLFVVGHYQLLAGVVNSLDYPAD